MDTLDRVKRIVGEELQIDWQSINPDDDIQAHLGADSLHMVNIVMISEGEFDIKVTDEEASELRTTLQIADFVSVKLGGKVPARA